MYQRPMNWTPARKSREVQISYAAGSTEKSIADALGLSLGAVRRYVAPAKKAYAVELFKIGFAEKEIAALLDYKPETVASVLRSSSEQNLAEASEGERLARGIKLLVDYSSAAENPVTQQFGHRLRYDFRKVKLPKIIEQAISQVNLGELWQPPTDSYEKFLFQVHYGGHPSLSRLANWAFNNYVLAFKDNVGTGSNPQEISVDAVLTYLRQGIISEMRNVLKFPAVVDREGIEAAIGTLTPMEQDLVRKRFFEGKSVSEVAESYNRSHTAVRQRENKAKRKLLGKKAIAFADPERMYEGVKRLEQIVEGQRKDIQGGEFVRQKQN